MLSSKLLTVARGAFIPLLDELIFSRASARTNPVTGAEIASGVAYMPQVTEVTAALITEVEDSSGYVFRGQHPDGRYIFTASDGTYASDNGLPPYTKISSSSSVIRVTPAGTLLASNGGQPAVISRIPGPDYDTPTNVLTMDRGFPATQGVSGVSTSWGASAMNYAADGNTIWLSEYGGSDIKDSSDSPRSLWRSDDDGVTWERAYQWEQVSGTHHHAIYYDEPTGNLYCSIGDGIQANSGIWKSTDRGDSWTKLTPPTGSTHMQPVSAMRFGDYIVWGTDTVPTGIWLHDPATDAIERIRVDYTDSGSSPQISWTGVVYYLAVVNDLLLVIPSQGHENYHTVLASDDGRRWFRLIDMDSAAAGWSQPVLLQDGSLLLRPGQTSTPNFVRLKDIALRTRTVLATDFATVAGLKSATPLVDGVFTSMTGDYVEGGGPNGMRAAKIGLIAAPSTLMPVAPGEVIEWTMWSKNPLGMSNQLYMQMFYVKENGDFFNQTQRTISNAPATADWKRTVYRFTVPAEAVRVAASVRTSGFTYNADSAYYLVAGVTLSRNVLDVGMETHDRATESATVDRAVGAAWGVYDRIFPRWDTGVLNYDVTLMVLTDLDTSDTVEVVYNSTDKTIDLVQVGGTVSSNAIRCLGEPREYLYGAAIRRVYSQPDAMTYGVRCDNGAVELVVWDKTAHEVAYIAGEDAFAPSNLRIEFPASGTMHLPYVVNSDLSDDQIQHALMGVE